MIPWPFRSKFLATHLPVVDRALLALGKQIEAAFTQAVDPVLSIAALGAFAAVVSAWPEGVKKYVVSVRDNFTLTRTTAPLVTDGITIVAAGPALTYWVRDGIPATSWQMQASWFVNPGAVGNDEASGIDAGHPLKTVAEWRRRVGLVKLDMILQLMADIPDADDFPALPTEDGARLLVRGTLTEVETGVVAVVTAEDPTTNTPLQFSKAAGDFSTSVGLLVYFTERTSYGFIAKDVPGGGHIAAILPPRSYSNDWNTSGTAAPPQNGDHYHIFTLSKLPAREYPVHIDVASDATVIYSDCEFSSEGTILDSPVGTTYLRRVRIGLQNDANTNTSLTGAFDMSCVCIGSIAGIYDNNISSFPASLVRSLLVLGAKASNPNFDVLLSTKLSVIGPLMCEGCGLSIYTGAIVTLVGNLSVFDAGGSGVLFKNGGTLDVGNGKVYGNGNTAKGVLFTAFHARILNAGATQTKVFIDGGTGNVDLGAATLMPAIEGSAGAVLPAASASTTWAQVFAAPFSGRVINYDTLSAITP